MKQQDIINAYCRIRTIDQTIPDDVLDFMKDSAIIRLNELNNNNDNVIVCLDSEYMGALNELIESKTNNEPTKIRFDNLQSDLQKASKWMYTKTYSEQHALSDKYFESRNPSLLSFEQVVEMWEKETQNK